MEYTIGGKKRKSIAEEREVLILIYMEYTIGEHIL